MIVAKYLSDTHPTEVYTTSWTCHFVAPIYLLNWKFTARTFFGGLYNVVHIHLFCDLIQRYFGIFFCIFFRLCVFNSQSWAFFTKVHFLFATQTKCKSALCALTKVLSLVNFSWSCTFYYWTPSEIVHAFYGLIYAKLTIFFNQVLI